MKKVLLLTIIGMLQLGSVSSHYKAAYHVIIDTDGGPDDFRAICMLLATPEVEVIAITCTGGILSPDSTWSKVTALLHKLGHEGIPVGKGRDIPGRPPGSRKFISSLLWSTTGNSPIQNSWDAAGLIRHSVEMEDKPVDFLALGPLGNLAEALHQDAGLDTSFRKLLWFNESWDEDGVNYRLYPTAAEEILGSKLTIEMIRDMNNPLEPWSMLLTTLDTLNSEYADAISDFYTSNKQSKEESSIGGFMACDLIPLRLVYPELFRTDEQLPGSRISKTAPHQSAAVIEKTVVLLDTDREDKSIIFKSLPHDPELFEDDVKEVLADIRSRHGLKEWKIIVLTNEFHEHLGIYSIIGAKMGLRAREFFNVGIDELHINSHAGFRPPLSCMNDGLQVSTGATLGHGTITVQEDSKLPEAVFSFKDQIILIRLKDELAGKISQDIKKGIALYGLNTDEYWLYVRELALGYWLEMDRKNIFTIERI